MIIEQGIRLVTTQIHICLHDDNQTSNLRTKQNFDSKSSEKDLRLSHLKLDLTNFTCVRSKTNCNFLLVATDKGLTQCSGDDTPSMHPSCKSFSLLLTRQRLNPVQVIVSLL